MTARAATDAVLDRLLAAFRFMLLAALFTLFARAAAQGDFLKVGVLLGGVIFAVILAYGRWWLLLAWVMATPTVLILANNTLASLPVVNGPRLLFAALAGVAAATILLRRATLARLTLPEVGMLVMVPFLLTSGVLSLRCAGGDPVDEAKLSFALLLDAFVMPYFAYWVARQVAWTDARVRLLLGLFMVVGVYVMIAALGQYFLGVNTLSPQYATEIHQGRARGTFINAAEFGAVMVILAGLAFNFLFEARNPLTRMAIAGLVALFLFGVGLSLTRSVWLSVPVALLWLAIADRRARPYLVPVLAAGGIALAASLPFIMEIGPVADRLNDVTPVYNRVTLYMTALSMGMDNPLTGVGFGRYCFMANSTAYASPFLGIPAQYIVGVGVPHNEFLHMFALTGAPGLALYALLYLALFRQSGVAAREPDKRGTLQGRLAPYAQVAVLVVVINALLVDVIFFSYLLMLCFFLAGVASAPRAGGLLAGSPEVAHAPR